jgi:DNA-binding CsgD family transcriptional regulator
MNGVQTITKNENEVRLGEGAAEEVFGNSGLAGDQLLENTLVFSIGNGDIPLTKREAEILRLIAGGHTNKQIAKRLSRSERTVEYHRNRLMRKMTAHNPAELVRRAIVLGVV